MAPGAPFTNFVIDGVITLNTGDPAIVNATFDGSAVRLLFSIPCGSEGTPGGQEPPGPLPDNFIVDGVRTLNPAERATVQTFLSGSDVHFQFGIPRGFNGNDGGSVPQGPPGEVTTTQLNSAINGTSNNSNAVSMLDMTVSDPPTQSEMQAIASKQEEFILALRS